MSNMRFKLAAGTNVGLIRQNNEDNFIVCPDLSASQWLIPQNGDYAELGPYGALLVVADGMGGENFNNGLLSVTDRPYRDMWEEMLSANLALYRRLLPRPRAAILDALPPGTNAWGVAREACGKPLLSSQELLPTYLRLSQAERERQERMLKAN